MSFTRLMLVSASAILAFSELSMPTTRGLAAASQEAASRATAAKETVRIRIIDFPRPVQAAVRQIEGQFGRVVTYEDTPYVYAGDIVDITAEVSRSPDTSRRVLGRRTSSIDVSYVPRTASIDEQVTDVLNAVIQQASAAGLAGTSPSSPSPAVFTSYRSR